VVTVGDVDLHRRQSLADLGDGLAVGDAPQPVQRPVGRGALEVGRPRVGAAEGAVGDTRGVAVQAEDLREMRPRRPHQLEPVFLGTAQRPLVRQDDLVVVVVQAHAADEAAPVNLRAPSSATEKTWW
jgi:hypothetical protein